MTLPRPARAATIAMLLSLLPGAALADWTAYAIDGKGAVGHGRGGTRAAARNYAIQWCGRQGCNVIMVRADRCQAIAESRHNGYWVGTGAASARSTAIGNAIQHCGDFAPIESCKLRHAYCK